MCSSHIDIYIKKNQEHFMMKSESNKTNPVNIMRIQRGKRPLPLVRSKKEEKGERERNKKERKEPRKEYGKTYLVINDD